MNAAIVRGKVDFGIITIREDEFIAVLDKFPDEIEIVSGRSQYNLRRLKLSDGKTYTVAIVRCVAQGNGEAQQVANALIEELAPRWLLVVGIGGAVPATERTLGDVVVSTHVADFNVGAVLQDGSHEYALQVIENHRHVTKHAANLAALRRALGAWNSVESIGLPRPGVKITAKSLYGDASWKKKVKESLEHHLAEAREAPGVSAGAIACSDLVIKDAELLQVWLKITRQVIAVEMESAGVGRAARASDVPFFSIRGLSDVVGFKRDPKWTEYACHSAAAFTRAFLLTRPIEPIEPIEPGPGGGVVPGAKLAPEDDKTGPSSEAAPWHMPFPHNPSFVGRAGDLDSLHKLLQAGRGGALPVALIGMGGTGKTQLAVEYAYAHRDAYPGGVYWVNAAGDDWRPALEKLAIALDLTANDAPAAERQLRLITALAEHLRARPDALVIFDNVDRPSDLLSDGRAGFLPVSLGGRLLFTTRRGVDARHFRGVELSVLTDDAALELLLSSRRPLWDARQTAEVKAEIEAGYDICRALGALPLAVTLAAAFLAKSAKVTLAGYRGRIKKYGALPATDTNKLTEGDLATRHPAAMGATLASQWESLETDEARLTLRAAALLDEAAEIATARLSLLTGLAEVAEEGFPVPMDHALQELKELRLVEELTETRAIRLHPLVRELVAKAIEAPEAFKASCAGNLGEALWQMGRLNDEVAARGVDAVIDDLRIGVQLSRKGETRWIERLMRPLDREAHGLRTWTPTERPELLLQQMRNRCFEMEEEDGRALAEEELKGRGLGYLRERVRTSRESEALVRTLEGHTDSVRGVAVTADGRQAISASSDHTLKVWDLGTGKFVRTLEGHTESVIGVAVTAAGQVVSASEDKTLKVWDLGSGELVRTLAGHTAAVYGVVVTAAGQVVSASEDKTLKVWDLGSGELVRTLAGHTSYVTGVAVTADGQVISASWDMTLKVWDLGSGKLVRTLEGHTDYVTGVAVTAAGQVISASWDRTLKIWDLASGEPVRTLEGHTLSVRGVAVTAAGQVVSASADGTLKVWDLGSGELVRTLEGHTPPLLGVAVTADGQVVSASKDGTLKVWDLGSGELDRTLAGHTAEVCGVAVTAAGQVVSASADETLKVWDLGSGKLVRTLKRHTAAVFGVAVTAAGQVVSASEDKTLKVWDLGSGKLVRTLDAHTSAVSRVAVTAAGQVVSVSGDNILKVWDLGSGELVRTLQGHTSWVSGVAVTADGRRALSTSADRTLRVWDVTTSRTVALLETHAPLECCAIVSAHLFVAGDAVGVVHIIEWIQPPSAGPSRAAAPRPVLRPTPELPPTPR